MTAELNIDRQAAQERLASLPIEFGFPLRDYQKRAIHTVENALANDAIANCGRLTYRYLIGLLGRIGFSPS